MNTIAVLSLFLSALFLFSHSISLDPSFSPSHTDLRKQCLDDQKSALLQLQQGLYISQNFTFSSKAEFWDLKTDCCSWSGVTCDALGHVIGLDLNYKNLSGSFHSVFNLSHLQRLNLAGNNFNTTLSPFRFESLPNLTYLNLSDSCFHGQIPMRISYLTRLVSLDLSYQRYCYWRNDQRVDSFDVYLSLKLEKPNFKTLIKNLRSLRELYLDSVNISTQSSKRCESTSLLLPNLRVLSMSDSGLIGPLCSSLSKLRFLSKPNLDGNPVSYLPPNFLEISSSLVSLSLSSCNLSGHFPTEVFLFPEMQTIDISENHNLTGQLPEFPPNNNLRFLSLFLTNFSGNLPRSISNLKFLKRLDLMECHFFGSIPSSIVNLTNLVELYLSYNNFRGLIPPFHRSGVPNLAYLYLNGNRLSGSIPSSLFTLPSLLSLYLDDNQLVGEIDDFPNASSSLIESLYVGYNNFSSIKLDIFFQLKNIRYLDLSNVSLLLGSDNKSFIFPQLEELTLKSCNLTEFPEFIKRQDKLAHLDLSNNQIHGLVPNWLWKTTLSWLDLSFNVIDFPKDFPFGDANSSFPMLMELHLGSCNISMFPKFLKSLENLNHLDLSNNKISGIVPNWLWKTTLSSLDLSFNAIGFPKDFPLADTNSSFPMLWGLYLGSCNISIFPEFLKSQEKLRSLDLSSNKISGAVPNWLWKKSLYSLDLSSNHLSYLDQFSPNQSLTSSQGSLPRPICNASQLGFFNASYNNFSGPIPNCLSNISTLYLLDLEGNNFSGILPNFAEATQLYMLKVGDNRLEGKLPRSLAKCTQLEVLDVGNNMIYDTFPFWLEKLPLLQVLILRGNRFYGQIKHLNHKNFFPALDVLDIASNQFSGELSIDFFETTQLRSLKIGGNKLEGKLPRSLANCTKLEVLDFGNNTFHDTFPFWLEKLPSLKVLILRSNRFYGTLNSFQTEYVFQMLRILDIASNNFSGELSIEFLQCLRAMTSMTDGNKAKLGYIGDYYYQDSMTIVNKGIVIFYQKILTILTCLDLSNNSFHGRIPEEIQNLKSLKVLNLSQNDFSGQIPLALENLEDLESLDLSQNKLSGKIPPQLTGLTFLEALNLSYNQLGGSIPQSNQFNTFSNDSYKGNPGLCGPPLSWKCNEIGVLVPPPKEDDLWVDGISCWKIALMGYGSGLVIGFCIGYTVLNELGNKWFDSFTWNKNRKRRSKFKFLSDMLYTRCISASNFLNENSKASNSRVAVMICISKEKMQEVPRGFGCLEDEHLITIQLQRPNTLAILATTNPLL
ncbi:hypothetical protein DITRI_Ditri17bG0034500 [Diplodiscus trichospermus]